MKPEIHQFAPWLRYGDGISRGIILIQEMLIELGYHSKIYTKQSSSEINLKNKFYLIKEYTPNENDILVYHFSYYYKYHDDIMKIPTKKIMIYHNITPSHFFDSVKFKKGCDLGRLQLKESNKKFIASIADSKYNCEELLYYNYKNTFVLPLLVDSRNKKDIFPNKRILKKHYDTFNILFVGRVIQNKAQHLLIDVLKELSLRSYKKINLFIVGKNLYSDYFNFLFKYAKDLGLENQVIITNSVTEEDLHSYYKISNLYLSLSEHEGFGMPIIEAINHKVPVLAYDCGSISTTLGKHGLLKCKAANTVAKKIIKLIKDDNLLKELALKQQNHLKLFKYDYLKDEFNKIISKCIEKG
ncbi:glycosyltransferase family 4 protein [Arcobacter sp.]|uniref:glycosyltransferase family 4 protein n=1 Tax=Arcobacter sp. TaxID=1872629 RepID=UPI003C7453E4